MSFGFSVGDFIAAGEVIKNIISSLRNSSASSYQEFILKLHALQRTLQDIEHLQHTSDQEASINSVKVAALMCQHPLDAFATKLRKFEQLGVHDTSKFGKTDKLKLWGKNCNGVPVWMKKLSNCVPILLLMLGA